MKDFKQYWLESKSIALPFHTEDKSFSVYELTLHCANCDKKVKEIRGEVKESFGCIEIHMVGVCRPCKLITGNRSRIYPKTNRYLTLKDDGWYEGEIKQNIFYKFIEKVLALLKKICYII